MTQNIESSELTANDETRLKYLFKKNKKMIGVAKTIKRCESPVVMLIRRNNTVELYENQKSGYMDYKHTDGSKRKINLVGLPLEFPYGKDCINVYICHEDNPTPMPQDVLVTVETWDMIIEKVLHDYEARKRKMADWDNIANFIIKVFIGVGGFIAAVVVVIILYKMLVPPEEAVKVAVETASNITNATIPVEGVIW